MTTPANPTSLAPHQQGNVLVNSAAVILRTAYEAVNPRLCCWAGGLGAVGRSHPAAQPATAEGLSELRTGSSDLQLVSCLMCARVWLLPKEGKENQCSSLEGQLSKD